MRKRIILKCPWITFKCKKSVGTNDGNIKFLSVDRGVGKVTKLISSLGRAAQVQKRAAKEGYGVFSVQDAIDEAGDRLKYLRTIVKNERYEQCGAEIGDLLFSISEIARLTDTDAESALYDSCQRFMHNFLHMLEIQNRM
jgi:uncharacterized protein YabN with tetrapyrrole methylase and pyrophosphatase domain